MLEALVIIVALGGLEVALWLADHKRQAEQLATLEAIWVELALLNEGNEPGHPRPDAPGNLSQPSALPVPIGHSSTVIMQ